jgi:hypothetical protein
MKDLATVLFPPRENTTLTLTPAHESFHFLGIHSSGLRAICYSIAIFKVNAVFVQEMQSLLFVV